MCRKLKRLYIIRKHGLNAGIKALWYTKYIRLDFMIRFINQAVDNKIPIGIINIGPTR